jgi:biopolymer transport protein ExbD
MAGSSFYNGDDDNAGITDINVTPFVDVVLVLLVVFIVTAKLIVARGVEVDKPKAAAGGDVPVRLRLSVAADGALYVMGDKYTSDDAAIARIKQEVTGTEKKAVIAGDRKTAYDNIMHAIDLLQAADVTQIALENVKPQ